MTDLEEARKRHYPNGMTWYGAPTGCACGQKSWPCDAKLFMNALEAAEQRHADLLESVVGDESREGTE